MVAPVSTNSSSSSRTKATMPKTAPQAALGRVTRLRAAKEGGTTVPSSSAVRPAVPRTPSNLLAMGKEGLRKVSDKIKDKEAKSKAAAAALDSTYAESLQAFLRIRPTPQDAEIIQRVAHPYLEPQDEQNVLMRAPLDPARPHVPKPPHVYSFDRVFGPETSQSAFFQTTTLPLVDKLLAGENGLIFAYGVSNSGKTYTIQGGSTPSLEERGVLPRAIDVVFNSISGLESKANLKCQGLADIVLTNGNEENSLHGLQIDPEARIDDVVKIDRNFSYAVFVSYSEVYNEKIFDLLDAVLPSTRPTARLPTSSGNVNTSFSLAAMANGGAGILKRRALVLKNDPEGSGKYIAGLHEIRVRTRDEALAVFRSGQRARQVFGTMANRESSRSHGIFTIKVVRIHNGAPEDPDSAQVSRLAIVDLAGSERTRNTGNTGDRLREAGSINKSLMVLGQCLEVLRQNQQKVAQPIPGIKKRLAVVPFRHSKLTEIFQNFFVGDGRAVMIVHVNPYDTGFDENSHVMRFSAVAREIQTTAFNKVTNFPTLKKQISTQFSALKHAVAGGGSNKIKVMVPVIPKPAVPPTPSKAASAPIGVSASAADNSAIRMASRNAPTVERESEDFVVVEEELEVVEEDEEEEDGEDDHDVLVDYLFEQLKDLKTQLFESEMRNASIEVEIRDEVAREMQEVIQRMHADFTQRLRAQMASGEIKTDMKIDILSRTMAMNTAESSPDQSFTSAMDESMVTSNGDEAEEEDINESFDDPFVIHATKANAVDGPESETDNDEETEDEDDSEAGELDSECEIEAEVSFANNSYAESEDVMEELKASIRADPNTGNKLLVGDTCEDKEAEENTGDEEEEEETDDDEESVDEDEGEENEDDDESIVSDSSFAASSTASSASPSPVRRASVRRRPTGTPQKPRPSSKSASALTPKRTPALTPMRPLTNAQTLVKVSTPTLSKRGTIVHTESWSPGPLSPLGESLRQQQDTAVAPTASTNAETGNKGRDQIMDNDDDHDDDDDEGEEDFVRSVKPKKRTLGKRIVTEDEIEASTRDIGGADVRRMVRGL